MQDADYSFTSASGEVHELRLAQLEERVKAGSLELDQTVLDKSNGQTFTVRELLYPASPQLPSPPAVYAAYPRTNFIPGPVRETVSEQDLRGFNWGAFAFTWLWGLNHRKPALLIILLLDFGAQAMGIPVLARVIQLGLRIFVGVYGNRWAWESGRFNTLETMRRCERSWQNWFIGLFVTTLILGFGLRGILHR